MYELRLARSARKELEVLPDTALRVRVGDYRIIYHIDDRARLIEVRAIRDRKDAYE